MPTRAFLVPALVVTVAFLEAAPEPSPSTRPRRSHQDLVLFGESRPYLIRLHLHVEGRPFQTGWEESVEALFRFLDADGDGALNAKELGHAPSPAQFLQLRQGSSEVEPDAAPTATEMAAASGNVMLPQFKAFYRKGQAAPLQVVWGSRTVKNDVLTEALFAALDRDRDGQLSREELDAAPTALARFDSNNDEMLADQELAIQSGIPPFTFRSTSDGGLLTEKLAAFAIVDADGPDASLARRLLAHYDKDRDGKLTAQELGLEPSALARLDANRDGALDAAELAHWSLQFPDLELVLALGDTVGPRAALVPAREGGGPAGQVRQSAHGTLLAMFPNLLIDVGAGDGVLGSRRAFRKALEDQFKALDANRDGYLDPREVHKPASFGLVAYLRLADRNGDGRISAKEWSEFLDVQEKLITQATVLTWVDRGRSLFELLDADHDGKLSPRELRSAWKRLSPWATGPSHGVNRKQLPHQHQVLVSFGLPGRAGSATPGAPAGFNPAALLPAVPRRGGPLWFRKMDRNGDGEVSPREFLGTPDHFRRIDTDGDGLIDADEAERADAWFRKK